LDLEDQNGKDFLTDMECVFEDDNGRYKEYFTHAVADAINERIWAPSTNGNSHVTSLLWHEATSSLIASTRSDHIIFTEDMGREYLYGDFPPFEGDEGMLDSAWPSRARHEKTCFGTTPWHINCSGVPPVLQYAFETGHKIV
jgi:hypothetical protein